MTKLQKINDDGQKRARKEYIEKPCIQKLKMCNNHLFQLLVSYIKRKAVPLFQRLRKKKKNLKQFLRYFIGMIWYKNPSVHSISLHR